MTWLRKRDGSVVYAIRNPDGSWFEAPLDLIPGSQPIRASSLLREFLREIGRKGGQSRARRHSREELAAWGRVRHKKGAKFSEDDVPSYENQEPSS
jgi:general stress protein YciG